MNTEMFRIETIGQGYFAVMAHPASNGDPGSAISEIAANGIGQVISLLEAGETRALGLDCEGELVSAHSMEFLSFPVPDMGLPASVEDFTRLSWRVYQQVESGINTLVHCRGGIGRSGMLAAAVLLHTGLDAQQAFIRVTQMRGMRVPETTGQGTWLADNQAAISGVSQETK